MLFDLGLSSLFSSSFGAYVRSKSYDCCNKRVNNLLLWLSKELITLFFVGQVVCSLGWADTLGWFHPCWLHLQDHLDCHPSFAFWVATSLIELASSLKMEKKKASPSYKIGMSLPWSTLLVGSEATMSSNAAQVIFGGSSGQAHTILGA